MSREDSDVEHAAQNHTEQPQLQVDPCLHRGQGAGRVIRINTSSFLASVQGKWRMLVDPASTRVENPRNPSFPQKSQNK
eukprot:3974628-Amphidinium_carterae.1